MKNLPIECEVPKNSQAYFLLPNAYFYDSWQIQAARPELDALEQFLRVAKTTPPWIDRLMTLRNRIVGYFGLKNLGSLAAIDAQKRSYDYQVGDRVGIFTLLANEANEALLGDDDKHLKVVVSVHKREMDSTGQVMVTVTTVVHVKNWLGRLYMLPVAPAHKVIAYRMVKAVG